MEHRKRNYWTNSHRIKEILNCFLLGELRFELRTTMKILEIIT